MDGRNPKVDAFMARAGKWRAEFEKMREIVSQFPLAEDFKWGQPCYTYEGKNVVIIHGFKEYCAYLFFKGALLKDPMGLLIQQTENVQSARQVRFTEVDQIVELEPVLAAYVQEAIEVERAGLKVEPKPHEEYTLPDELQQKLDTNPELKKAFAGLTPGRQRAYILYFAAPKQAKTREARVEKAVPQILAGKGLND